MGIDLTTDWEILLDQILQHIPDPAMVTGLQGSVVQVNDHMLSLIGLSREQAIGQSFPYSWTLPPERQDAPAWLNRDWGPGDLVKVESSVAGNQGSPRGISFSVTALNGPDGEPRWLLSIGLEVAPQILDEGMVSSQEWDLPQVVDAMPAWVQVCQMDGTVEMVNREAGIISGYTRSDMLGQTWPYPWFPSGLGEAEENPFTQLGRSGGPLKFEAACKTPQGQVKELCVTLALLLGGSRQSRRMLMVAQDVTESKNSGQNFLHAEKLRVVSQLAAGVAHDVNNDLAVILGYSEYLLGKEAKLDEEYRSVLSAIQLQAQACAGTVRRIQLFSSSVPRSKFTYFSFNDVVRDVVESMEHLWATDAGQVRTGVHLEADLQWVPPVHAHLTSLSETVVSLIENAVSALPEGGKVSLRTRYSEEQVVLEIADNGAGIAPADMSRIFEPFFTTKGPASSGLGLSIAYNLVMQMNGSLSAESALGEGTTFTLRLPSAAAEVATSANSRYSDDEKPKLEVMVVDDEALVAEMLKTLLKHSGFHVTVFLNGAEAIEAMKEAEFNLLVVDLGMPEMDGWEVSRQVNKIRPEIPIIVATGWNITVDDGQDHGAVIDAVLSKPFAKVELDKAVETALSSRGSPRRR